MKKLISLNLLLIVVSLTPMFKAAAQTPAAEPTRPEPERRVGVRTSNRVSLTLREAVMMALENNRDIEIERLNARMNEFDLRAARGVYDPALTAGVFYDHRVTPVASLLAGGADGRLKTTDFAGTSKITQRLPWQGGRVQAVFDQSRATSQNLFNSLNPQFTTGLSVEFAQPLFRDRRIDEPRRQIKIAKKRLDLSDSQFRQRAIEIVAQVERAYWDLVFALRDEEIKRESVELARTQLAHNQRLVEQGAIAPVDVVSARVEVERRIDEAEAAVETIQRAENALKALTLAHGNTEMWSAALTPVEKPELDSSGPPPFDDALKIAFKNRPEMEQYRLRGELNSIDVDYFRNQTKPRIDLIASYGTFGLAGKERRDLNPISASQEQLFARVNRLSQIAGLPALPPFPIGATLEKFIGGYGQSLGNLFRNDYRAWRVGVNIELSLGNRTAKARMGRALVEGKQIDAQRQRAEQMIEVEVRNALQAVETARRRVEAAKNSRANAELQHASERRKFDAGQSTNFFVLDRQNALSAARGRELKALTDYNKAVSELQSALSTTLVNNNVAVAGPPVQYRFSKGEGVMSQPNKHSKKVLRAIFAVLLLTGALTWWFFLRESNTPREIISVSGRIEGDDASVAAKTSGRVREITVREGDQVKAGQVIATLDDEQVRARVDQAQSNVAQAEARLSRAHHEVAVLQAQLEQSRLGVNQARVDAEGRVSQAQAQVAAAEASLARAEADYKQTRADAERFTTLAEQGDAPAREGEQARAAAEAHKAVVQAARKQVEASRGAFLAAKANLENPAIRAAQAAAIEQQIRQAQADIQSAEAEASRARAQLQEAVANRGDLQIIAPFDGTVATRSAEPGEVVSPGTPIMTIVNLSNVYLRAFIPEGEIGRVRAGQSARVYLDSNPKQPLEAVVARIDPQASFTPENTYYRDDRVKQVVGVKLQLTNSQGFAKPGMPADGEVLVEGDKWVATNRK